MKNVRTLYWVFTGIFTVFTLLTSISQVLSAQSSVEVMNILKFPLYMLSFLGVAKIMGMIAVLIPNFQKIKEWAYAGFMFDYIGATYSMIAVGGTIDKWGFMIVPILLCWLSYYYQGKLSKSIKITFNENRSILGVVQRRLKI